MRDDWHARVIIIRATNLKWYYLNCQKSETWMMCYAVGTKYCFIIGAVKMVISIFSKWLHVLTVATKEVHWLKPSMPILRDPFSLMLEFSGSYINHCCGYWTKRVFFLDSALVEVIDMQKRVPIVIKGEVFLRWRCVIIDCSTNSFHMVVAMVGFTSILVWNVLPEVAVKKLCLI